MGRAVKRAGAGSVLLVLAAGCAAPELTGVAVTLRGYQEIGQAEGGLPVPRVLGPTTLGLCLEVPAGLDTSRWQAELRFDGRPSPGGRAEAAARMADHVCFDADVPADLAASPLVELCGEIVDRFDGRHWRLPCSRLVYETETSAYQTLDAELEALLRRRFEGSLETLIDGLDRLRISSAGRYPAFELRLDLIAAHYLSQEGAPEAIERARRRLEVLPAWTEHDHGSGLRAAAYLQRAVTAQAAGRAREAWQALAVADRAFLRIADPKRISVVMQQARVLNRAGAFQEARSRLRAALDDCAQTPCQPRYVPLGRGQLAWTILLDPYAAEAELDEAEAILEAGLAELGRDASPLEKANHLLDLGYLRVRQRRSPAAPTEAARQLLRGTQLAAEEVAWLRDWSELIDGLGSLETGSPERAAGACEHLTHHADARVAGLAWSCLGRVRRARGDVEAATRAFESAAFRYEQAAADEDGRPFPAGVGERASVFAEAARGAVDLGDPARAWDVLARLDLISAHEGRRRQCRERKEDTERWRSLDAERQRLLAELDELDRPASDLRRRQLEPRRRHLRQRLRDLWWEWPGCGRSEVHENHDGVTFRAFALDDEILLLHRHADGRTVLERRSASSRSSLRRLLEEISQALADRALDDESWRRLTEPLARALLPNSTHDLPRVTAYALHGLLQGVPLAALPIDGSAARWFGELTAVALVPADAGADGGPAAAGPPGGEAAEPLFVVDPRRDLTGARGLLAAYREHFPRARILDGLDATREAFRRQLAGAAWLHVDAHGFVESAVPELSGIELADRPLRLMEIAELSVPRRLVNLSGCDTGRAPPAAEGGRYGLGGMFSRIGADWVIASASTLSDQVARDFNEDFYRELERDFDVPGAYRRAVHRIQGAHPAAAWAGILLLGSGRGGNRSDGVLPPRP